MTNSLSARLYEYLLSDPTLIKDVKSHFVIDGIVTSVDLAGNRMPNTPAYGMVGVCGITYLTYDGRSRKAKELDDCHYEVMRKIRKDIAGTFTPEEVSYFEKWGCPIMAVLQQNQAIQIEIYERMVKFAKEELGIKNISYRSVID